MEFIKKCNSCGRDIYHNTKQYTIDEGEILAKIHENECDSDYDKALEEIKKFLIENNEYTLQEFITEEKFDKDFKSQFEINNYGLESFPADKTVE